MRLISADSLKARFKDPVTLAFVKEMIDAEPEAIVRCQHCRYYDTDELYCKGTGHSTEQNAYCSYGERRTK